MSTHSKNPILLLIASSLFLYNLATAEGFPAERLKCPLGAQEMGDAPPDGNLIYCVRVIPGKSQPMRHGPYISWYRTGELKKRGEYRYGKLEGTQTEYYSNGLIKEKMTYIKGGLLDGEHVAFYPDGTVEVRENYKGGKLDGHKEQNYRNGAPRSTADYKDGTIEGIFVLFHQNSQPRVRGFYHSGNRSGTWTTFWDNGVKRLEGQFSDGKADGTWTRYSKKGNPLAVTKFEIGNLISRERYKNVEEEKEQKGNSIDERDRKKFAKWNRQVKRSLREQRSAQRQDPEYIPRDEKKRLALERKREYQVQRAVKKKAARERELDAILDNQKNPFYGMFSVGKKKKE